MQNQSIQGGGYGSMPSAFSTIAAAQHIQSVGDQTAVRQLEVPHQIDMLDRNLAGLMDAVTALEARLASTVLRPEPGIAGEKGQLRGAQSTPISSSLQEANDKLVSLRVRVESMLTRMEV